ncbi:MAG: hypothetical protein ACI4XM_07400 [Candidatus Coprovivens sp.]
MAKNVDNISLEKSISILEEIKDGYYIARCLSFFPKEIRIKYIDKVGEDWYVAVCCDGKIKKYIMNNSNNKEKALEEVQQALESIKIYINENKVISYNGISGNIKGIDGKTYLLLNKNVIDKCLVISDNVQFETEEFVTDEVDVEIARFVKVLRKENNRIK